MNKILEEIKIINGLAPAADRYNSDPATDIVNAGRYDRIVFLLFQVTAGTNTGTATITIEECDDVSASNSTAIAFKYLANVAAGTSDDFGAWQTATASGFSTTANKTAIYAAEVSGADLTDGYPYVRMVLTESVDDPVTGCVLILGCNGPKGDPNTLLTAIV